LPNEFLRSSSLRCAASFSEQTRTKPIGTPFRRFAQFCSKKFAHRRSNRETIGVARARKGSAELCTSRARELLLPRQALHSTKLAIDGDYEWTSELPNDLAAFVNDHR
jgi:hypothetical protein